MYNVPKNFIDAAGGYRAVAARLGIGATTLHTHMMAGRLPAKWYDALIALAHEVGIEPPTRALFSFEKLPEKKPVVEDDAA